MLYVPDGCAHGYQTLGDDTEMLYQTTAFYAPDATAGVRCDDPTFGIEWPDRHGHLRRRPRLARLPRRRQSDDHRRHGARQARARRQRPIRVGDRRRRLHGTGIALQMLSETRRACASSPSPTGRSSDAERAFTGRRASTAFEAVSSAAELQAAIERGGPAITDDPLAARARRESIDVVIEATGEVEFGGRVHVTGDRRTASTSC